ncbi:unnamed protein product [Caenorhabditis sp. 36 PRJEB53466]|nr:unnamed protein product [Caenorhabditis sp. 36 PRJEB53466]
MSSDAGGSGDSKSTRDRIASLARKTQKEKLEDYKEKHAKFNPSKRAMQRDAEVEDELFVSDEPSNKRFLLDESPSAPKPLSIAERLMQKMGHKAGAGLGKHAQGIAEPVGLSTQRGRTGLGSEAGKALTRDFNEAWNEELENKTVEETVKWLTDISDEQRKEIVEKLADDEWIVVRRKKLVIDDEINFCEAQVLKDMIEAKNVFDAMSDRDLREARARANPYETIGSAFFQNRAAMKTANMDKIYDWILSRENTENNKFLEKNPLDSTSTGKNIDRNEELFYFADVCAGPGGFSEYMLWRKGFYNAKGFGFTLAGKDDFKLQKFSASSAYFFETFYGTKDNGDVMDPENIDSLEDFIMRGTDGRGVHLMMADGGFSVEGQENIQEILSKRLYLCQLLVSLCIVREGGNFFCKLFDIFTPFSVDLIYLMRVCYDSVSLHKPHTSRPANSERYITCKGLRREYSDVVKEYLKRVNLKMDVLKNADAGKDVEEIMPLDIIKSDSTFMDELIEHNHHLAIRQTLYLRKYQSFAKNQGQFDKDQGNLKEECLKYWSVPNRGRPRGGDRGNRYDNMERLNPTQVFGKYSPKICGLSDFGNVGPEFQLDFLKSSIPSNITYDEYRFVALGGKHPNILIAAGDTTFIFKNDNFEAQTKNHVRIPENTVILVDMAEEVEKTDSNKIKISAAPPVIRILDAAVLAGDDVSKLPYEERLRAARKFATALRLTNRKVKEGWGRKESYITPNLTVAAQIHSLGEIENFRSNLEILPFDREITALFKEGDFTFKCHGLRFARVLKAEWQLGWSKSQQRQYAHSPHHKCGSLFEEQWEGKNVYASFWDTVILTSKEKNAQLEFMRNGGKQVLSSVWSWKPCIRTPYGPDKILNHPEAFDGRPTLAALKQQIVTNDETARRVRT